MAWPLVPGPPSASHVCALLFHRAVGGLVNRHTQVTGAPKALAWASRRGCSGSSSAGAGTRRRQTSAQPCCTLLQHLWQLLGLSEPSQLLHCSPRFPPAPLKPAQGSPWISTPVHHPHGSQRKARWPAALPSLSLPGNGALGLLRCPACLATASPALGLVPSLHRASAPRPSSARPPQLTVALHHPSPRTLFPVLVYIPVKPLILLTCSTCTNAFQNPFAPK